MNITNGQIHELGQGMRDYFALVEKDKSINDVTQERMLKITWQVKYTILNNWNHIKKHFETIETIVNDKIREFGGVQLSQGNGMIAITFSDPEKIRKNNETIKDKKKLKEANDKISKAAKANADKFNAWHKEFLDSKHTGAQFNLRAIKPIESDIPLLPDRLISAYMELTLFQEPTEEKSSE